jgi:hypothetical protein
MGIKYIWKNPTTAPERLRTSETLIFKHYSNNVVKATPRVYNINIFYGG